MTSVPLSRARAELASLVDRVSSGEEVTITRHGQPVAVLVRPDALRTRRRADKALAGAAELHGLLEEARSAQRLAPPGLSDEQVADLVDEVRRARDAD